MSSVGGGFTNMPEGWRPKKKVKVKVYGKEDLEIKKPEIKHYDPTFMVKLVDPKDPNNYVWAKVVPRKEKECLIISDVPFGLTSRKWCEKTQKGLLDSFEDARERNKKRLKEI